MDTVSRVVARNIFAIHLGISRELANEVMKVVPDSVCEELEGIDFNEIDEPKAWLQAVIDKFRNGGSSRTPPQEEQSAIVPQEDPHREVDGSVADNLVANDEV